MGLGRKSAADRLDALSSAVEGLRGRIHGPARAAAQRFLTDAGAARFHLAPRQGPLILAILGGTGAGKSTLLNRLLDREVSAASFRRTFTSGAVAVVRSPADLPDPWLGIPHESAPPGPARGKADVLTVVVNSARQGPASESPAADLPILVDTPDLDGDQPLHHAQADRVFRWAEAVLFLVTPEKYQMTELLPYYRLARRYALPAIHVMNKCESNAMLQEYAAQREVERVYALPRDDAAYEPAPEENLSALRAALTRLAPPEEAKRKQGNAHRLADLAGRLADEVIEPTRRDRRQADALMAALRAIQTPATGVDLNPITRQLRHRLRQRSVLYLMGPQRVLDRVRQTPLLLARLPRATWDILIRGKAPSLGQPQPADADGSVPDFPQLLQDQFTQLLSRIDDTVRSSEAGRGWMEEEPAPWQAARIDPTEAAQIARQELDDLKQWLQQRWNATPRDTRLLQSLVRRLPGGEQVLKWTETAPYLLTILLAAHGALFGHLDLAVLGGYSLAAWIMERLSNEVTARTRQANTRIEQRFTELAERQLRRSIEWVNQQAPDAAAIKHMERLATELAAAAEEL